MAWTPKIRDIDRILTLAERVPGDAQALTRRYRKPGGTWTLNQDQADALATVERARGGLLMLDVGAGKTLLGKLLPYQLGVDPSRALVICPASGVKEAQRGDESKHFLTPPGLMYRSFTFISRNPNFLRHFAPELIIVDEAHNFRNHEAARTASFLDYVKTAGPMLVGMSATLADRSLMDFHHLADHSLGDCNPLPRAYNVAREWASVVDVNPRDEYSHAASRQLQRLANAADVPHHLDEATRARLGIQRWLGTREGMVISTAGSCEKPLVVRDIVDPGFDPSALAEHASNALDNIVDPDGEYLPTPLHAYRLAQQLSMGYYYRWIWEDGEKHLDYTYARSELNAAVSEHVSHLKRGHETPGRVMALLEAGLLENSERLELAIADFNALTHRAPIRREVVWLDDTPVRAMVERVKERGEGILWYQHHGLADKIEELGVRVYRAGERPADDGVIAASVAAHGTGLNLQTHRYSVVLEPPSTPRIWQQLLGRLHRQGQTQDVLFEVAAWTDELRRIIENAVSAATFVQETLGIPQKILDGRAVVTTL